MIGVVTAIAGAAVIAAVSTFGDFVWATSIPRHRWFYGVGHGTLLFLAIGLFLGTRAGRPAAGAVAGAIIGAAAAGSFYLITPITGYWSMFVVWVAVWVALGLLHAQLNRIRLTATEVVVRGAVAAVASGAAFYAISGIWMPFNPRGWDYAWHFGAWMLAYLPGFAALLAGTRTPAPAGVNAPA